MFGRVKDAMADAAETLRQAFAGLRVVEVAAEPFLPQARGSAPLGAEVRAGLEPPVTACREMQRLSGATEAKALEPFQARLCAESGWARWGAEAEVIRMTPLAGGQAARVAVPPLPRKAQTLGRLEPLVRPAPRRLSAQLPPPGARRLDPTLEGGTAEAGLELMLSLAVPIRAEAIHLLPKGLWMRYSLQLVRGTGENVRNLEVLGLFRLPSKGVADLRHDPGQGRILVRLEASAVRAPRAPFILARRKDDGSLVSCFVEDP
ncbi:MAG: hypothetical protein HXX12_12615 [Geothrix sp.]|uniref:hypothetical protein n=1 Tax=Geothrix sp. TaxID=1962974 RepID=UPI0017F6D972|nr:hypothetical protein [Geothrix sp.]NWJ41797.1 hypothetical protein [Geothrix sp.]WIL20225.1 MAG: hypothetical protein QOZ81_002778 [Geothrix sp.]